MQVDPEEVGAKNRTNVIRIMALCIFTLQHFHYHFIISETSSFNATIIPRYAMSLRDFILCVFLKTSGTEKRRKTTEEKKRRIDLTWPTSPSGVMAM